MAEQVTQTTITQAPDYLKPGIEKFLEFDEKKVGNALKTASQGAL